MVVREGRFPAVVVGVATIAVGGIAGWAWAVPGAAVLGVVLWLYFDRRVVEVSQPTLAVAPISGVVTRVDDVEDPWFERRARRVRVRAEFPGVGPLLAPIEAKVVGYDVSDEPFDLDPEVRRQRWPAWAPDFASSPNCYAVSVRDEDGDELVFVASSVRPVSRLRLDACPGERVSQGRRYAFAYFVDMVDVLVPAGVPIEVAKGQRVTAGEALFSALGAADHNSRTQLEADGAA